MSKDRRRTRNGRGKTQKKKSTTSYWVVDFRIDIGYPRIRYFVNKLLAKEHRMRQIKVGKRNGTVSRKEVRAAVVAVSRQSRLKEHVLFWAYKNSAGYFVENFYEHTVGKEFVRQKRATSKEISEALTTLVRDGCLEIVFIPWNGMRSADILLKLTPRGSEKAAKERKTTK